MKDKFTISVEIPTSEGFVGRACSNSTCKQYFKVHQSTYHDTMYCPYCGDSFSSEDLITRDQMGYLKEVAREEAFSYAQKEFQNMLKRSFGTSSTRKSGITYKPGTIKKNNILPKYKERKVDSEVECPDCNTKFQVYGVFGFCPGCREENVLIYNANIRIIEMEISTSSDPQRQLRHAYNDLVSTFENICARKSKKVTTENGHFQDLFDTRRHFKKHLSIDILQSVSGDELLTLKRVFQKRHIYTHSDGTINEKYVQKVPEDQKLLGQKAELSIEEFRKAAICLRTVIGDLVKHVEQRG